MTVKTIRLLTVLLAAFSGLISFTGCQEETKSLDVRRVRLIFDENLKLKKQLKLCDAQNQKQKVRLATYEKEQAEMQKYMDDFTREQIKDPVLMRIIDEISKQLEDLILENEQLKSRIKELEAELDQNPD